MSAIGLLTRAGLRVHRVRHVFAILAIAGATALLVVGLGAHDAVAARARAIAERLLGRHPLVVLADQLRPTLAPELVAAAVGDPAVAEVRHATAWRVTVADDRQVTYLPSWRAELIAVEAGEAPGTLRAGRWLGADAGEVVVAGALADGWQVTTGGAGGRACRRGRPAGGRHQRRTDRPRAPERSPCRRGHRGQRGRRCRGRAAPAARAAARR